MTNHDVAVATSSDETSQERPDRSLAEQLVDQARADGRNLVGPGGLLSDLTKQVLETGLEVEMEDHVGYAKHAAEGRNCVWFGARGGGCVPHEDQEAAGRRLPPLARFDESSGRRSPDRGGASFRAARLVRRGATR